MSVYAVEADDIFGSLPYEATPQCVDSMVAIGENELAQLVNGHVELVHTMNGERLDVEGVRRKFGVEPSQIVDYLMLVGDNVDNIPGVPKVGPKTAAKWLNEYGSLEHLIEKADKIKGVAGENLRNTIPHFALTRQLVTIKIDCETDINGGLESLVPAATDTETLVALFERYGFRSWLRELTGDPERVPEQDARVAAEPPPAPPVDYETVLDPQSLDKWVSAI